MRAVQVTEFGGPEVLKPVELPDPVAVGAGADRGRARRAEFRGYASLAVV